MADKIMMFFAILLVTFGIQFMQYLQFKQQQENKGDK